MYAGQGRSEYAGNCRHGHPPNRRPLLEFAKRVVNTLRQRQHAKIDSELGQDEEDGDNDEESNRHSNNNTRSNNNGNNRNNNNNDSDDQFDSDGNDSESVASAGRRPKKGSKNRKKKAPKKKKQGIFGSKTVAVGDGQTRSSEEQKADPKEIVELDADGKPIKKEPIEYTDWVCIVCKLRNHQPSKVKQVDSDIHFGEKGVHYKRIYAVIQARRNVPTCTKCGTYADYSPPLGSAHLFPFNPKASVAFDEYPKPSTVQAGLAPDIYSRYYYSIKSFFFGIKDNIDSAPLKNDWRLEKFVNNRFPELPRYILKPGEFYQLGEVVECKQQKFEFNRAKVIKVHPNFTYDIRYDPGDELRFVEQVAIRTIPEKRAYAFRVEMGLVLIAVISPLGKEET